MKKSEVFNREPRFLITFVCSLLNSQETLVESITKIYPKLKDLNLRFSNKKGYCEIDLKTLEDFLSLCSPNGFDNFPVLISKKEISNIYEITVNDKFI